MRREVVTPVLLINPVYQYTHFLAWSREISKPDNIYIYVHVIRPTNPGRSRDSFELGHYWSGSFSFVSERAEVETGTLFFRCRGKRVHKLRISE